LIDRRKQAKLQCLQGTSLVDEDNLSNLRREASEHFRNKKREYFKDIFIKLVSNSKNKNISDMHSGINEFKNGYQPRTNLVKMGRVTYLRILI
jgi:restriction endonuclease S subunit